MSLFDEDFTFTQENLALTIDSPFGEDYLLLRRLVVEESLSKPFRCVASLVSERLDLDPTEILGKPISVTLHPPPEPQNESLLGAAAGALLGGGGDEPKDRFFHGIVTLFRLGAAVMDTRGGEGGFRAYNAEFIPRFGMLQYTSNCRIFQQKTVLDIIDAVMDDHGLSKGSDYSTSDVSGPLTKRSWDYCVQYNESDLQFLSRLMEEVGIYYYFEHEESKHKLVLCDKESLSIKTHEMSFRTSSRVMADPKEIRSWEDRYLFQTGKLAFSDFDYRETASDLTVSKESSEGHDETKEFELFEYPVPYQTSKADVYGTKSDGTKLADIHMQVLDFQRHLILGSSSQRELMPGHLLKITEQQRIGNEEEEGEKHLVISVRHEMQQEPLPFGRGRHGGLSYSNSFTCLPPNIPYRPARVTPKPRMYGPQTAIVVGAQAFSSSNKNDQEVMTDKLGRVKVQFPWDRRQGQGEKKYESCSCWIRVAQGAAGAGWGMINVPRKGEEVIVDFLNGDPDQPIITGRVYNPQNKNPYALHESSPSIPLVEGGDNRAYLSGFKSCSGKDGDPSKNYNELRFQDRKGKEHVYFHAEKDFVRVVENKDVLIVSDKSTISNDRIEKVTKDTKDGSQTIEIYKDRTITIQTGDEKIEVSEGDRAIEVKKGEHTIDVAKDITITSGKNINVEAQNDKIELVVGQSSITMKKDGTITIKGKAITIDAMQTVKVKAMQKVDIEGTMGVNVKGLQYKAQGQATAEVNGSAMAKVKGGVTFVN